MSDVPLESAATIDLASVNLTFEDFRLLSRNPNLSVHEKIGFPDKYREGYEALIFADIKSKLGALLESDVTILDIGPGCANLPKMLIAHAEAMRQRLILVDSVEMLTQLPDASHVIKVEGAFPQNLEQVRSAIGGQAAAIICYSVFHYMFTEGNPFSVVDGIMSLLAPSGSALIGDIPNISKRQRFFNSPTGVAFHKNFMKTDEPPEVKQSGVEAGRIDDAVLSGLVQRCQIAGFDAYVVPQPPPLPMANRRDDLLIRRP